MAFSERRATMAATLIVLSSGFMASAVADGPPTPQNVCVNGQCGPASSAAGGIKWHPGHYVWLDPHATQAARMAAIDALSSETSVKGVQVLVNWASLEGPTQGDYSQGFALIDSYLAKLGSLKVPKHLMLGVNERSFGTPPAAGTSCLDAADGLLPDYLAKMSDGGCAIALPNAAGNLKVMARFWEPAVMDRLIALSLAYANRYDSNPLFEMFMGNSETSVAAPPTANFDMTSYYTQLNRWFDASRKVWPHTQLRFAANYGGSNAQMASAISYVTTGGGVIVGGPDPELPLPNITRTVQANQIFRGAIGGTDLRPTVPWVGEVQDMGLGFKFTQLPSDIYTYEAKTMHASYMIWLRNTWDGGAAQMWDTGILPFIKSINGAVPGIDCPTIYQQGCNSN